MEGKREGGRKGGRRVERASRVGEEEGESCVCVCDRVPRMDRDAERERKRRVKR